MIDSLAARRWVARDLPERTLSLDIPAIYDRYGPMVLRRCRHLLKDDGLAQDAAQDVFVQLVTRKGSIEDRGLSSLLFQMATGVSLNRLRARRRHPEDRSEGILERIADATDPETLAENRGMLRRLFERESPSTRVIATLHWVDGMTHAEVAREVGMSVSGVRKRLRQLQSHATDLMDGSEIPTPEADAQSVARSAVDVAQTGGGDAR